MRAPQIPIGPILRLVFLTSIYLKMDHSMGYSVFPRVLLWYQFT